MSSVHPKPNFIRDPPRGPFEQNEFYLHLYLHHTPSGPDSNQTEVVNHEFPKSFGKVVVNDWGLYDGFGPHAKLFARAQGLHIQAGMRTQNWYNSFIIVFVDARLKGSSLEVMGPAIDKGQWAIVGGTGELSMARGIIYKKNPQKIGRTMVIELDIHAFCKSRVVIKKLGLRGSTRFFEDEERDMDVNGVSRIVRILIRHEKAIHSIEVYFERHGQVESTGVWGRHPGGTQSKITLKPHEYITSIIGGIFKIYYRSFRYIWVVGSLTFVTNLSTYGPYGKRGGIPFKISSSPSFGGRIVGFHARSGEYLTNIGVYVKELSPISAENAMKEDANDMVRLQKDVDDQERIWFQRFY